MDLWIRTQNKSCLRKVSGVKVARINANKDEWALFPPLNEVTFADMLGKYKTKEKAMAVLDEIQKALSTIILTTPTDNYTDKDLKRAREFGVLSSPSQTIFDTGCVVYTMPEDVKESE